MVPRYSTLPSILYVLRPVKAAELRQNDASRVGRLYSRASALSAIRGETLHYCRGTT